MKKPEWKAVNARLRNARAKRQEVPQPILITNCLTPINLRASYFISNDEKRYLPDGAVDIIVKQELERKLGQALTQYWDISTYEYGYGTEYQAGVMLLMKETLQ